MRLTRLCVAGIALLALLAPIVGVIAVGQVAAAPAGFATVPSDQVNETGIPDTENDWLDITGPEVVDRAQRTVMADRHASTLSVEFAVLNTKTGKYVNDNAVNAVLQNTAPDEKFPLRLVLNVSDDTAHEGRRVTVQRTLLKELYGHEPDLAYGTHEDGTRWVREISYEDNHAIWRVPKFSSNTITFEGTFNYTATPVSDGGGFSYNISDLDAADNFTIDVTGNTATAFDNESASGVGPGSSQSIGVGGNLEPTDGAGGNTSLQVTAHEPTVQWHDFQTDDGQNQFIGDTVNDNEYHVEVLFEPNASGDIQTLDLHVAATSGSSYDTNTDIYIVQESGPDQNTREGTLVKDNWEPSWGTGEQSVSLGTTYTVDKSKNYSIEFVTSNSDNDGSADDLKLEKDDHGYVQSTLKTDASWSDKTYYPHVDVHVKQNVENLGVDDNNGHSATFSAFSDGETQTVDIDLKTSSSTLDWTGSGNGTIDWTLTMMERTQTEDPTVEVNGNTTSHTGALSDGTTESLTTDTAWLSDSHTNRVNITVGDGTLSADAPTPQVDLVYEHEITGNQSVSVTDEVWSERYNVSKTYDSDRTSANLSIPFQSNIYSISEVRYRRNESGGWSAVSSSNYGLTGTTVDIDIDGIHGGTVPAGTTYEIKVNGSKVNADGGSITVQEPTTAGNDLDSKVKLDTWGSGAHLEVNRTGKSTNIHYAAKESWAGADEYTVIFGSNDQQLYLPQASAGGTFRVRDLPVTVSPEVNGDVRIEVESPSTTEPEFVVATNGGGNDDVSYTFESAKDDQYYELWSKTEENVRDAGTAGSPLTLNDDDSNETLIFREATQSSGGGGGGGGGGGQVVRAPSGPNIPLIILAFAALLVVVGLVQWQTGRNPLSAAASGATDAGTMLADRPRALAVVLLLGFGIAVFTGIIPVPETALVVLAVAAGAVVSYFALQRSGNFTIRRYALVVGVIAFGALTATGQLGDLFEIIGTPGIMLLIGGGLYLAWKTVQRATRRRQIIFRSE